MNKKAIGVVVMTQSAITFPLPRSRKRLHCGIEWEDTLCTIVHNTQSTQNEYTEGVKYRNNKGHYLNV